MSKLQVDINGAPNEIKMTRVFDAPKRLVLKAMSDPELIKKWLGGKRAVVTEARHDMRVGGTYKHAFRTHEGYEFYFTGTYIEISDDRVVHTEKFNEEPGEARITVTFSEHANQTTVTWVMAFPTKEIRDMVVGTGMSDGAGESYDELEKLLVSL